MYVCIAVSITCNSRSLNQMACQLQRRCPWTNTLPMEDLILHALVCSEVLTVGISMLSCSHLSTPIP